MEKNFAVALSEKEGVAAVKEVSLKIKSVFPKNTKYIFIFFTPRYDATKIAQTVNFTLTPQAIFGIQSPFLIFEDRLIEHGVVACCINKETAVFKDIFIQKDQPDLIESSLRLSFKSSPTRKQFLLSSLSSHISPYHYLRSMELSMGKAFTLFGGGFMKKYASKNFQIINTLVGEGLSCLMGEGLEVDLTHIEGFLPLGKPFTITKAIEKSGVITEINNQPAVTIYQKYLEEKFPLFKKASLMHLYPLGIKKGGSFRLINVIECLDDGSLVCIGNCKENEEGHIMLLNPPALFDYLSSTLSHLQMRGRGLIFMINTLTRKKILKEHAEEEIRFIKRTLGNSCNIVGIYADYTLFPDKVLGEYGLESANILLSHWR